MTSHRSIADVCFYPTVSIDIHHGGQAPLNLHLPSYTPSTVTSILASKATSSTDAQVATSQLWSSSVVDGEGSEDIGPLWQWNTEPAQAAHQPVVSTSVAHTLENQSLVLTEDMKQPKTKATIGILSTLIAYVSINSWYRATYPRAFQSYAEDAEEVSWRASSKSWVDRKACRWLSTCGASHMKFVAGRFGVHVHTASHDSPLNETEGWDWRSAWTEDDPRAGNSSGNHTLGKIPDYVLEHAPLVHLYSGEQFWPCDLAEHLYHVTPTLNYTPIQAQSQHPTLHNLNRLNRWDRARWVFLTSNDNPEERPEWLEGKKNIPAVPDHDDGESDDEKPVHHPGRTFFEGVKHAIEDLKEWYGGGNHTWDRDDAFDESSTNRKAYEKHMDEAHHILDDELKRRGDQFFTGRELRGGRSDAPAILIVVDKGEGVVDAFWFFFYGFNLGNTVFNIRFGNHVGDWEHTAIRFLNGDPKAVFFSEHNFGSAYSYEAVEKLGKRPVIYSATGTHAMYPTAGTHPYVLPWGILHDQTDKGPLWDPALNAHAYTYNYRRDVLRPSTLTPKAPTGWFYFGGHWGDKFYPLGDKRQYRFAGQYHYVNGPQGPRFKNLGRKKICGGPDSEPCYIKPWLEGPARMPRLQDTGEEADAYSFTAPEA